jgi:hypothetical protein
MPKDFFAVLRYLNVGFHLIFGNILEARVQQRSIKTGKVELDNSA